MEDVNLNDALRAVMATNEEAINARELFEGGGLTLPQTEIQIQERRERYEHMRVLHERLRQKLVALKELKMKTARRRFFWETVATFSTQFSSET